MAYHASAQFYDLFALGKEEEQLFYREIAREVGSPALELGVGTGLFAVFVAKDGVKVVGIEKSPEMLNEARKKLQQLPSEIASRLLFLSGDVAHFSLEQQFKLIYIPSGTFQYLETATKQMSCLQSVVKHLAPDGRFVFDVWVGTGDITGGWRRLDTVPFPEGGAVSRSISTRFSPSKKLIDTVLRFDVHDEKGVLQNTYFDWSQLAYLTVEDVEQLLDNAGFQIVEIYSTFTKEPWQSDADQAIFVTQLQKE